MYKRQGERGKGGGQPRARVRGMGEGGQSRMLGNNITITRANQTVRDVSTVGLYYVFKVTLLLSVAIVLIDTINTLKP